MNFEATVLDVEQPAGAAEIVQQVTIDVEKIGILTDTGNDMLVPDLGQQCATGHFQIEPPSGILGP